MTQITKYHILFSISLFGYLGDDMESAQGNFYCHQDKVYQMTNIIIGK